MEPRKGVVPREEGLQEKFMDGRECLKVRLSKQPFFSSCLEILVYYHILNPIIIPLGASKLKARRSGQQTTLANVDLSITLMPIRDNQAAACISKGGALSMFRSCRSIKKKI